MNPIRQRQHRLPDGYYHGYRIVSFTLCLDCRSTDIMSVELFRALEELLREAAAHYRCVLPVYLFMPDHAHLILSGSDDDADPLSAMKRFKQRSSFWLVRNHPGISWQRNFYDHILRKDDDVVRHVRYILLNPVRAGIVENWKQYPFRGSSVYELDVWDSRLE